MKVWFSIIATVLVATATSADEPTFDSVQAEFRQKAVSLLTEEGISAQEFQTRISEIANATFGSHAVLMKKETANRFRRLPVFSESSLVEFTEHKSLNQFPLPPTDDGLLWITFGWEPVRLADVAKKAILARTLTPEQHSRRAFVAACCPDKIYRLGEGEYPDLVVDSLGDLFVIKVEMTKAGCCKPVSVNWMKPLADDAKEIRNHIPAAAGMTLRDMDMLAKSPTPPKPSDIESKTLTLMLLSLKVRDDEEGRREFRHLSQRVPNPGQLAEEIYRSVKGSGKFRLALGPVTMIHSDRITNFTCAVEGDKATGTVSFKVPNLFEGQVNYAARRRDGSWKIEEFIMPLHEIYIAVAENGNWVQK